MLAPILLFTFNRLEETKKTVESLSNNLLASESELFVFSDGPRNEIEKIKVQEVRDYLREINGFKKIEIYESEINKGLAKSVIEGVTKIVEKYGKVIVLEDDLKTTTNFLSFLNEGLKYYEDKKDIYAINGYSPLIDETLSCSDSVFYHSRAYPWGWATWKDRWDLKFFNKTNILEKIDGDPFLLSRFKKTNGEDAKSMLIGSLTGKNNSWYIRWIFSNYLLKKKSVFPVLSKVDNIGFNESGTHCGAISAYKTSLDGTENHSFDFNQTLSLHSNDKRFLKYFSKTYKLRYRLSMLKSYNGMKKVLNEFQTKLSKDL